MNVEVLIIAILIGIVIGLVIGISLTRPVIHS